MRKLVGPGNVTFLNGVVFLTDAGLLLLCEKVLTDTQGRNFTTAYRRSTHCRVTKITFLQGDPA